MIKRKGSGSAAKKSATAGASARVSASGAGRGLLDLETVRELARIATEFDLAEVEADPSGHVRVSRRPDNVGTAFPASMGGAGGSHSLSLMSGGDKKAEEKAGEVGTFISSPFVGTFYRSPNPDSGPFVDVGQSVRKGQVVCIVEAMKLMNEIESEFEGKVLEIMVKNGAHVEYGQPLFKIEKL